MRDEQDFMNLRSLSILNEYQWSLVALYSKFLKSFLDFGGEMTIMHKVSKDKHRLYCY